MKNKVGLTVFVIGIVLISISFPFTTTVAEGQEVLLGGIPLGIGLAEKGLIVTGLVDVITDDGAVSPARCCEIQTNDLIIKINDTFVSGIQEFASALQDSEGPVTLTVKRGERELTFTLTPVTDCMTGLKKLGLTVKSGITGIGTLTFVMRDMRFGALGHGIVDADTGKLFQTDSGSVYSAYIGGFNPASSGKAGELIGRFVDRNSPIGTIDVSNEFGVYGTASAKMTEGLLSVPLGSGKKVRTGAAYIYSTIEGSEPKKYEIEIIKAQNQRSPKEKSMLIRVTDRQLLEKTGGILQGMSGSPIVQDGALVGAVTHVLVSDSTLGYGLYIDWMLPFAARDEK